MAKQNLARRDARALVFLLGCSRMSANYGKATVVRLSARGLVEWGAHETFGIFRCGFWVELNDAGRAAARELAEKGVKGEWPR